MRGTTTLTNESFRMETESIELMQMVVEVSYHLTRHRAHLRLLAKAVN
jgi:hypothetical protein